jgi:hypothetical protein
MYLSSVPPCSKDYLGHDAEIFVQEGYDLLGLLFFRDRCESADIGEENGDRLIDAAERKTGRVIEQLLDDVFGHEAAVVGTSNFLAGEAFVSLDGFDRHRGLGGDGTDQLEMIRGEGRKWVEPIGVEYAVDVRFRDQRGTNGRAYALRDDRFGT